MSTRRKFLQTSVLSSAAVLTGKQILADTIALPKPVVNTPIVISTWDFGKTANIAAWEILAQKGRAVDAVEAGVRIPEADPTNHTIGYGGYPDRDGYVTLDACIMDEFYNCGSVMALQHITHAISVARLVMEKTPHIVLAGDGALQFALANGFKKENLLTPESEKAWKEWMKKAKYEPEMNIENRLYDKDKDPMPGGPDNHDTIGMLAMDAKGNLGGACTTSGMAFKMHGRVGDSPIIGAGTYANNATCAISCTGHGELFIRSVVAYDISALMEYKGLSLHDACRQVVMKKLVAIGGEGGLIAIDKDGNIELPFNSEGMYRAMKSSNGTELVAIYK